MPMTLKEAIDYLQPVADSTELAGYGAALAVAVSAMREMQELMDPKPLTREELRELVGQWVWVVVNYEHDGKPFQCEGWAFVPTPSVVAYFEQMIPTDFCGHKFNAYRQKPQAAIAKEEVQGAMADYIKRSDALKVLETMESVEGGLAAMHELPAANVVEVKHGWWVSDEGDVLFHCSECDAQICTSWDYEDLEWRYCPNCGAKMEE